MVSTHLKNISQIGSFPQVGMKIKDIWRASNFSESSPPMFPLEKTRAKSGTVLHVANLWPRKAQENIATEILVKRQVKYQERGGDGQITGSSNMLTIASP